MHRSSGPAGTLSTTQPPSVPEHTGAGSGEFPPVQPQREPLLPLLPRELTRVATDVPPFQFDENDPMHNESAFGDCLTAGSLCSIHSAPPVPLNDLSNVQTSFSVGFEIGNDSPRRPISLAIDSQYHSTKTISGGPFQQQQPTAQPAGSEIEEEDNENMLTVSSLTARPLIAKSRELRTTK